MWGTFMKPNTSIIEISWPQFDWPFFYTCPNFEDTQNLVGHLRQIRIEINDNTLVFPIYDQMVNRKTLSARTVGRLTDIILPPDLFKDALSKALI